MVGNLICLSPISLALRAVHKERMRDPPIGALIIPLINPSILEMTDPARDCLLIVTIRLRFGTFFLGVRTHVREWYALYGRKDLKENATKKPQIRWNASFAIFDRGVQWVMSFPSLVLSMPIRYTSTSS
jgi:hypothetical protein